MTGFYKLLGVISITVLLALAYVLYPRFKSPPAKGLFGFANAALSIERETGVTDISSEFQDTFCALHRRHSADPSVCRQQYFWLEGPRNESLAGQLQAPDTPVHFLLLPGVFGECVAKEIPPFRFAIKQIESRHPQVRFTVATQINGRASSEYNSKVIHRVIEGLKLRPAERLVVIGYSKGATDFLHYLAGQYTDATNEIHGFVSIAGAITGTPLADRGGELVQSLAGRLPLDGCPTRDASGIESLSVEQQSAWLAEHQDLFPGEFPMFSVAAASDAETTSSVFTVFHRMLTDEEGFNDGQVPTARQVLPESYLLGYLRADHWAVALPFSRLEDEDLSTLGELLTHLATRNEFPRDILLEAVVLTVSRHLRPLAAVE